MTTVTIVSEPLIEQFGRGFSDNDPRPETPCSGDALNMAAAVSRGLVRLGEYTGQSLPHAAAIFCGLGDDDNGAIIRSFMVREGLDTRHVITLKGRRTAGYTIHRDEGEGEGGGKRSVEYQDRGPESAMCQLLEAGPHAELVDQAIRDIGQHADILVITGIGASRARSQQAFARLVDLATTVRNRGGKVIVDLNHRFDAQTGEARLWVDDAAKPIGNHIIRERMDRLFGVANLSFVADDELWPVYGNVFSPPLAPRQEPSDPDALVKHLRGLQRPVGCDGQQDVFFKRGRDGGTLYYRDENGHDAVFHVRNRRVALKERNGGGDALIGGTIAGLLAGFTLKQSLHIGQCMASQVIQHPGGVIQNNYLPTNAMLDAATGAAARQFAGNQAALLQALQTAPFVPVFQLTTHQGRNTIAEDAEAKVAAMHNGGIRHFEFLLRGDESLELDDYITQVLAAIDALASRYRDARFGVGTVSSEVRLQRVADNPHVSFVVTAHWPGEAMLRTALHHGKPIIPTVSATDRVILSADGRIAAPDTKGTDRIEPQRISALRSVGIETFKIFDFSRIARARGLAARVNTDDDRSLIVCGLVAIAEAIGDSCGGNVPAGRPFHVMVTGGVTLANLPCLLAGIHDPIVRARALEFAGGTRPDAAQIIDVIERMTVIAGGTFITRDYEKAPNCAIARRDLEALSRGIARMIKSSGEADNRLPGVVS